MSDWVRVTLPLAPMSKARPRMVHGGHAYMPARYRTWIDEAKYELRRCYAQDPLQGPLEVVVGIFGPKRPRGDLDNLTGGLWDACNGILWGDDGQINRMATNLYAADEWKLEIVVYPLVPLTYPKPKRTRKAATK